VTLPVGQRIGSYVIAEYLGEGGTSEVYLVRREGAAFALKILKEDERQSEVLQTRFINEAVSLRQLHVEGVVRVYDEGDFAGRPFYVMEYLPSSLAARLAGPLWPSQIVPIIRTLVRILSALHECGFVHRDIKPSNVLLTSDGSVRLADFSHSKLPMEQLAVIPHSTQTGAFLGTREYAAPEQFLNSKTVDGRADVYAVGLILFEALAGHRPFGTLRPEELVRQRLTQRAPRLSSPLVDLSPQLVSLVARMLELDTERRPTAQEVLSTLTDLPLIHTSRASSRRYATLLLLPVFISAPCTSRLMNQPPMEGVNAKPLTDPEVVKERFKEFDLALDQGTLDEATALLERLKALPPTPSTAAKLLQKQADMARELGQLAQARQMYREARPLFQQLLDRRDWASCALREADMMLHLGETVAAYELYDQASRNHSAVLTKPELARGNEVHLAFFHLGLYYAELRQFDKARELLLLAKDATPMNATLWMARTEERLAALPTESAPIPLARSAMVHGQQAVGQSPQSRRAQLALRRAELLHAQLANDEQGMQRVLDQLSAMWSIDKRRATVAHDYVELLMATIERQPTRTDWKAQAREVLREIEQRGQWQGDVHLQRWKTRLGA